ncbi:ABC transporter substrate-binding protein [Sphaerobacter thermophilus]|jgi:peptide/nickel transport system substrate-binding protein|uniref:Extracellular solute-binding protein family 5 n=1 Tax=Sphaerobacter thermophilus (strain ATCC 49802 / DSM 20745 / KCCM 41009 / NCIMB 13125 / S 6022) TaxID=479434 RepID=D1C7X6_SPHTD|nr:ABC transporter substrate-binding protein [Sphaerobacter thermophilus]ACZ39847.1 extracellular solute-binding protein family 5 [Sphaerobacter thermophilus DSM 20745]PZN65069.1 MAG: ABC transporter substrate-binding protein [Sphaerobacter thermophilus]
MLGTSRRWPYLVLVFLLLIFPVACGSGSSAPQESGDATEAPTDAPSNGEQSGKRLVIARHTDINSLDPHRAFCDTCQIVITATYQRLVGLDLSDNRTLIPQLATEWSSNEDLTQYTFKLDERATFADGSPVEAKDVKWSLERLHNLKGSPSFFMDGLESIETPDDRTVVINLAKPDSAFLAKMASPYAAIVNSDLAMENGATADPDADTTDTAEAWFMSNSAGSGPYVLVSYRERDEIVLTANENFWGDPPAIKDVTIREVMDAVAQRQLLEGGDVSIAMQISPDVAADMQSGGDIIIENVPSFNFLYLVLSPGARGLGDELNEKVRQAIRYAIDYEGLIDVTLGGAGRKQATAIPNGFLGTENLPLPERDLDRARQLMAEGGYPDGFTIDARYPNMNVYGVDFNIMMQKIQTDLKEIGIELNLQPIEFAVWLEERVDPGIPVSAGYYAPDHTDPSQYIEYFAMIPGGAWAGRVGGPDAGDVVNDTVVELYAQALAASDEATRAELYEQIGREMIEEAYIIALMNPDLVLAYRSDVQGMHYSGCCNLEIAKLSWK